MKKKLVLLAFVICLCGCGKQEDVVHEPDVVEATPEPTTKPTQSTLIDELGKLTDKQIDYTNVLIVDDYLNFTAANGMSLRDVLQNTKVADFKQLSVTGEATIYFDTMADLLGCSDDVGSDFDVVVRFNADADSYITLTCYTNPNSGYIADAYVKSFVYAYPVDANYKDALEVATNSWFISESGSKLSWSGLDAATGKYNQVLSLSYGKGTAVLKCIYKLGDDNTLIQPEETRQVKQDDTTAILGDATQQGSDISDTNLSSTEIVKRIVAKDGSTSLFKLFDYKDSELLAITLDNDSISGTFVPSISLVRDVLRVSEFQTLYLTVGDKNAIIPDPSITVEPGAYVTLHLTNNEEIPDSGDFVDATSSITIYCRNDALATCELSECVIYKIFSAEFVHDTSRIKEVQSLLANDTNYYKRNDLNQYTISTDVSIGTTWINASAGEGGVFYTSVEYIE
ncbi:MAG: hypothetical protein NC548_10660 [Lachnospiraceae bacterium]|nr:hypothetical protein [Lachnospiraceae bacterium]